MTEISRAAAADVDAETDADCLGAANECRFLTIFSLMNLDSAALLFEERIFTVVFMDGLDGRGGGGGEQEDDEEFNKVTGLDFFLEAS